MQERSCGTSDVRILEQCRQDKRQGGLRAVPVNVTLINVEVVPDIDKQ